MPVKTFGKKHHGSNVVFGTNTLLAFDLVPTVGASVAITVVQAQVPLIQRSHIYKVGVCYSAITNAATLDIVVGTGAPTGASPTVGALQASDILATAGQSVFGTPVSLGSTPNTAFTLVPTAYDALYDSNTLLTLRVTTAAAGSITNLKVILFAKLVDPFPGLTTAVTPSATVTSPASGW